MIKITQFMKYGLRLDIFLKNIVGQNHRAIFGHLLWQMVVYLHHIDFFFVLFSCGENLNCCMILDTLFIR